MGICTLSPFVVSSCRSSLALCGYNNLLGHERNNQRTALCRDSVHKINAGKPVINIKIVIIHPPFEMNIIMLSLLLWLAVTHLLSLPLPLPRHVKRHRTDICITNFHQPCKVFCMIFSTTHVFYSINNRYN